MSVVPVTSGVTYWVTSGVTAGSPITDGINLLGRCSPLHVRHIHPLLFHESQHMPDFRPDPGPVTNTALDVQHRHSAGLTNDRHPLRADAIRQEVPVRRPAAVARQRVSTVLGEGVQHALPSILEYHFVAWQVVFVLHDALLG